VLSGLKHTTGPTEKECLPTMLSLSKDGCSGAGNLVFSRVEPTEAGMVDWFYFSLYSSG
jgi:hypothetical protein